MIRFATFKRAAAAICGAATILFAPVCGTPASAQDALRIAAVVNDDIVSIFDLSMRLKVALFTSRLPDTPENRQRLAPQVLRGLIDERLQEQEAKRLNVVLDDADLATAVGRVEEGNRMRSGGLKELTTAIGVPYETLTSQIRAQALWAKTINRLYTQRVNPSAEDIQERLSQLRTNIGRPQFQAAEIFLPFDAGQGEGDVAAIAEKLSEQLRLGAPFPQAAMQFSRSPTAGRGGDLGWTPQGQLERELDTALLAMREGDVSGPIRTVNGYYILKLYQRRVEQAPNPADAKLRLSQIKLPTSGEKAISPADRDKVVAYVAGSIRGCPAFENYGKTLGTEGTGPLGSLRLGEMPPLVAQTVQNLAVGDPSPPVEIGGVATLLMVCERIVANGLPSNDEVRNALRLERLERTSERHLRDLRRMAVIDIRI
jgi:peptidyl-prolyl cis-trans isomerase SurA